LPFGDVQEDVGDLEDIIEVFLYAVAPFEDFVLVAGYFEALFAFFETDE
jgi:hypothetical protein